MEWPKGIKRVEKLWGEEIWLVNEPEYCSKILIIKPGYQCSLHYHPVKKESFVVLEGILALLSDVDDSNIGQLRYLRSDDPPVTLTPGTQHRFASGDMLSSAVVLEVSTYHSDDDVIRIDESKKI